ncbi:hypothetical protein BH09BAC3_BH09BAC3_34030 [soil metagenome]
MVRLLIYVAISLFLSFQVGAQRYAFKYLHSTDQFIVNNDGDKVYCFFKVKESKTQAVYRKVFLSEDLVPMDSVEYQIDGNPVLIASGESEHYTYHAFETKVEKIQMIQFLISDKAGNIVHQFKKTAVDFTAVFGKEVKPKSVNIHFIPDKSKDMLLLEVVDVDGRYNPRLVAWNISDGTVLWQSDIPSLGFIRTTETQVIGLTRIDGGVKTSYTIYVFDKATGKHVSVPFIKSGGQRSIDVVATNGKTLMIAGAESESNDKNSRLYMSMFDLEGNILFDRMDTTDRMGKYRRHLMGSAFDKDGNLVLIAEGYKIDATRAVATTAAAVALGVLVGGISIGGGVPADNKIDFITSAVMSSSTGQVQWYRNFPVGPWHDFATFYTDGERVLIGVKSKFLLYNVSDPAVAPSQFATVKMSEQLILTSFGPAVVYRNSSKSRIVVEMIERDVVGNR